MSDETLPQGADVQSVPSWTGALQADPEEVEYELRAHEGAVWTGGRLVIGIGAFAFASLAFSYFYLRSANSDNLWRPANVTAPTHIGGAIFALAGLTAVLNGFGAMRLKRGQSLDWEVAGWTGLATALVAIGLQIWEM